MTFDANAANAATHERLKSVLADEAAADPKPVRFTAGLLAGLFRGLGVVSAEVLPHVAALEKRVAELEGRIEQQKALPWRGVWKSSETYEPGQLVTFRGSMWHCNRTVTGDEPGADLTAFTLCVKKGRDGRHADRGAHHHEDE